MKGRIMAQRICGWLLSVVLLTLFIPVRGQSTNERRTEVEIRTELGTVVVALYNETPRHRDNFLKLVQERAYDSLLFHRVVPGFMVQGGDPDSKVAERDVVLGPGGPGYTLEAEILPEHLNKRGAVGAIREPDEENPTRLSNGSQFYIVLGKPYDVQELDRLEERNARVGDPFTYDERARNVYATLGGAPHLDGRYTVFGEVVSGMVVLDAMAVLPADLFDRPTTDIRMFVRNAP